MGNLEYIGYSKHIEDTLKYQCDYCKHCRRGKKGDCQLRLALMRPATKRTYQEDILIEKAISPDLCKWFESSDPNTKPPLPKDRDRR